MVAGGAATLIKGKYALDRRLGCGGMAEVFIGRRLGVEGFTRPVAIKRVLPEYSADDQFRAMFVAEARLSARLGHSNIVAVHDFDEDETGRLFLVMELVDGTDLDGLLHTGPLPLPVVLSITSEILRGLGHAHDLPVADDTVRGLVHRDVSPQNVLLGWDGAVKVSDFGIAKVRAATRATASFFLKGKVAYMSPEQANGAALDGRSDLFAVGVMLWEMLCGAPLFTRDSLQATLKSLLFDPVPSPREAHPNVPGDVERVTMRLLEKDREHRYRNADAAIADLSECAAYPRNGRELLSALLVERLPDRARQRSAGSATRLERPAPELGPAGTDPERTRTAPPTAPPPAEPVDPYAVAAGRIPRSRRIVPLALLGITAALVTGLVVGVAAHMKAGRDSSAPSSSASSPAAPPLFDHQPSGDARASTATRPPLESPTAPAHDVPAPAAAPQEHASAAGQHPSPAPVRQPHDRKARPVPARDTTNRSGIREIDLGDSSRN